MEQSQNEIKHALKLRQKTEGNIITQLRIFGFL